MKDQDSNTTAAAGQKSASGTKTKWTLDPAHSEISFRVRHMMITNVTGHLKENTLEVTIEGEDFSKASDLVFKGKAASIDTNEAKRDAHLRSAEFFDAEKYPEIVFKGRSFEKAGGSEYKLKGDLTIRNVTKPAVMDVEFGGIQKDPWGQTKAGFTVTGKINRKDWDLNWNAALEAGGVMVSDEVKIHCEIQLIKAS